MITPVRVLAAVAIIALAFVLGLAVHPVLFLILVLLVFLLV